jgi:TetR/AcrR family transcriptional repressor of nem operon
MRQRQAGQRAAMKQASQRRILDAAAARLRREGLPGAAIAAVMREAGLTHGAFYCHFADKEALAIAGLRHALEANRRRWVGAPRRETWRERLVRLGRRYLSAAHRDAVADGCALAALAGDAGRSGGAFRAAYRDELLTSLRAIGGVADAEAPRAAPVSGGAPGRDAPLAGGDDASAIAFLALCVGGLSLARAVDDPALSDRILAACRRAVPGLAQPLPPDPPHDRGEP